MDAFWLPVKDLNLITAVYTLIESYGITNLFGKDMLGEIETMCKKRGAPGAICKNYMMPYANDSKFLQTSVKDFNHVQYNAAVYEFVEFRDK